MYSAACFQFTKSVGKHTLKPVPSIDEKDNIKPFQLVIKKEKKQFIFFEKAYYTPTDFQLTDILTDLTPLQTKPFTNPMLQGYSRNAKISLKGRFGADIGRELFDAELKSCDAITLEIQFGLVTKLEISEPELLSELEKRSVNLEHPYIRDIILDKRNVLCVITGVALLPNGGTIHRMAAYDASANFSSSISKVLNADGDATFTKDKDLQLAPNTPLAYNIHELIVDKNTGAIKLVLAAGVHGGFKDLAEYDEPDGTSVNVYVPQYRLQHAHQLAEDLKHPEKVFNCVFTLEPSVRCELNSNLLKLMSMSRDMIVLSNILEKAESKELKEMELEDVKKTFLSEDDSWMFVLEFVGLISNGKLIQSSTLSEKFEAIAEFLDAATMLNDEMLERVRSLSQDLVQPMLIVLQEGIKGKPVNDFSIVGFLFKNTTSHELLQKLQFRLPDDRSVDAPLQLTESVEAVYWLLLALYGHV